MKLLFLTTIALLLIVDDCSAQLKPFVRQHYDLVNKGDEKLYHYKDTLNALRYYDKALNLFLDSTNDTVACNLIDRLISLYAHEGKDSLVYTLIKLSIKVNKSQQKPAYFSPNKWNKRSKYSSFRESKYWVFFNDSADYFYNLSMQSVDPSIKSLNKLYGELDYLARTANVSQVVEDSSCFRSSRRTLIYSIDSFLFNKYINHIKTYGVTNTRRTGTKLFGYSMLIHQFSSCKNRINYRFVDSLLLAAVYNGHLENSIYAFLKDRSYAYLCTDSQLYGHWITKNKEKDRIIKNSINNVDQVDKRRNEIGLGSLYIQSLKTDFVLPKQYIRPTIQK